MFQLYRCLRFLVLAILLKHVVISSKTNYRIFLDTLTSYFWKIGWDKFYGTLLSNFNRKTHPKCLRKRKIAFFSQFIEKFDSQEIASSCCHPCTSVDLLVFNVKWDVEQHICGKFGCHKVPLLLWVNLKDSEKKLPFRQPKVTTTT